jgi:putative transposase
MRKKRKLIEGAFYHVTSRTNDKIRVFENKLGRKIMLITLQDAKEKYRFRLTNFCIMPTHIHLLIQPAAGTVLSTIIQWIKTKSAKRWNYIHGSKDHLWGERYFSRAIQDEKEYFYVMRYIDQNPVTAGLSKTPEEWKASGAYYKLHDIPYLVDFYSHERQQFIKLLPSIPLSVSRLLPPEQLAHTLKYAGAYSDAIDRLTALVPTIPKLGATASIENPPVYLHYFTGTADYYITEYDGNDTVFGKACFTMYHPDEGKYQKFSLSNLKSNLFIKLKW